MVVRSSGGVPGDSSVRGNTLVATITNKPELRYWTKFGIARENTQLEEVRAEYRKCAEERASSIGVAGSDTHLNDGHTLNEACLQKHAAVIAKESFVACLREAPKPTQFNRGQVNHLVTVEVLDDTDRFPAGTIEKFILGGKGEGDLLGEPHTYACDSPIGRAVVNKEIGDIVTVRLDKGKFYEMEIISFELAGDVQMPKPAAKRAAKSAQRPTAH